MSGFAAAVAFVLAHEGGFQKKEDDRGNWTTGIIGQGELKGTNFGISAMTYPKLDIEKLTRDEASAIYLNDFWKPIKGDDLPPAIALGVFDFAVNAGRGTAVKMLQTVLGVVADGVLGPKSLEAAREADAVLIASRYAEARILYYADLKNWASWRRAWTRRAIEAAVAAVKLA